MSIKNTQNQGLLEEPLSVQVISQTIVEDPHHFMDPQPVTNINSTSAQRSRVTAVKTMEKTRLERRGMLSLTQPTPMVVTVTIQKKMWGDDLIDDRLYNAIFHSLEETHCAHTWFYMSD